MTTTPQVKRKPYCIEVCSSGYYGYASMYYGDQVILQQINNKAILKKIGSKTGVMIENKFVDLTDLVDENTELDKIARHIANKIGLKMVKLTYSDVD